MFLESKAKDSSLSIASRETRKDCQERDTQRLPTERHAKIASRETRKEGSAPRSSPTDRETKLF